MRVLTISLAAGTSLLMFGVVVLALLLTAAVADAQPLTQAEADYLGNFAAEMQDYLDEWDNYKFQIGVKMDILSNTNDPAVRQALSEQIKQLKTAMDDNTARRLVDHIDYSNEIANKWIAGEFSGDFKNLQTRYIAQVAPWPGLFDFAVGFYLFRETVKHDGIVRAAWEVAEGFIPGSDVASVAGFTWGAGLGTAVYAAWEIGEIHAEMEAWKDKVRKAMRVANHTEDRYVDTGYSGAIASIQASLDEIQDDERIYVGKAENIQEMTYAIGLLQDMQQQYEATSAATMSQRIQDNMGTATGAEWSDGDMDGDADVDFTDWLILSDATS